MKVSPAAAYRAYNKIGGTKAVSRRQDYQGEEQAQKTENAEQYTEQFRISPEAARQREVEQLTSSIMSQIREPASAQRLDTLRAAVQNKTYSIPTGDLVDAVMKQWFSI